MHFSPNLFSSLDRLATATSPISISQARNHTHMTASPSLFLPSSKHHPPYSPPAHTFLHTFVVAADHDKDDHLLPLPPNPNPILSLFLFLFFSDLDTHHLLITHTPFCLILQLSLSYCFSFSCLISFLPEESGSKPTHFRSPTRIISSFSGFW